MGLARTDIQAVLGFLAEIDELDSQEPFSVEMLRRLRPLIPSAVVSYQETDLRARGYVKVISDDLAGEDDAGDEDLYWRVGPCAIAEYRARTGDLTTIRMSDVIARSRFHEQPVYREYFAPGSIEYALDLGLGADRSGYRSLILLRERDESDFTERDRAVLELLRPHLRAREARAELARLASWTARDVDDAEHPHHARLTTREREIVGLVGAGKTNAQIAAELWVTPGTVKKHLENVYLKLGVGSRAAAANLIRTENAAG